MLNVDHVINTNVPNFLLYSADESVTAARRSANARRAAERRQKYVKNVVRPWLQHIIHCFSESDSETATRRSSEAQRIAARRANLPESEAATSRAVDRQRVSDRREKLVNYI